MLLIGGLLMGKNIKNTSMNYKCGTAFPIKNAGRPKGSKTKRRPLLINDFLKDELYRRRFRDTL